MIQRHTILINDGFSANTGNVFITSSTTLNNFNNYQVNNTQNIGGGITNPSNVRAFLNDEINDFIINDFFSYLTGNTTAIEFSEIYHSDQKLSDTFNDYYDSSILNNIQPNISIINENLSNTSGITITKDTIHNYNGISPISGLDKIPLSINNSTRITNSYSSITTYTSEESYYIPVYIKRNNKSISRLTFETCDKKINTTLNQPLGDGGLIDDFNFENKIDDLLNNNQQTEGNETNVVVGGFTITQK